MSGEPNNVVLQVQLRIDPKTDLIVENMHCLKVGMTAVEEGLAALNRRVDRLDRIERRLGRVAAPH